MRMATLIMVLVFLSACGQKGPLYLPQDDSVEAASHAVHSGDLQIADQLIQQE